MFLAGSVFDRTKKASSYVRRCVVVVVVAMVVVMAAAVAVVVAAASSARCARGSARHQLGQWDPHCSVMAPPNVLSS